MFSVKLTWKRNQLLFRVSSKSDRKYHQHRLSTVYRAPTSSVIIFKKKNNNLQLGAFAFLFRTKFHRKYTKKSNRKTEKRKFKVDSKFWSHCFIFAGLFVQFCLRVPVIKRKCITYKIILRLCEMNRFDRDVTNDESR